MRRPPTKCSTRSQQPPKSSGLCLAASPGLAAVCERTLFRHERPSLAAAPPISVVRRHTVNQEFLLPSFKTYHSCHPTAWARELGSPRQQLVQKIQNGNCFNRGRKIQRYGRERSSRDKPEIRILDNCRSQQHNVGTLFWGYGAT